MVQGRSTEIITMIKWIRTSRLSIKELSLLSPPPRRRGSGGGHQWVRCATPSPITLDPTPYTLHPTPYTLPPYPWQPAPYTTHSTPSTPHPTPYTFSPDSETTNPKRLGCGVWTSPTGVHHLSLACEGGVKSERVRVRVRVRARARERECECEKEYKSESVSQSDSERERGDQAGGETATPWRERLSPPGASSAVPPMGFILFKAT